MPTFFALIAVAILLAGCGDKQADTPPAATPAPAETAQAQTTDDDLKGYSQGVIDYYREVHTEPTGDAHIDAETEYHQPPKPAEAGLGETITLTGANIGVRLKVTVTKVERAARYTAVRLKLSNDGVAVYEAPLANAVVTYSGGMSRPVVKDAARGTCSRQFNPDYVRLDVGTGLTGCLLFEGGDRGGLPARLQLALETVPTEAGGIWDLG